MYSIPLSVYTCIKTWWRSACQCPPLAGRMCPHIVESAGRRPHGAPPAGHQLGIGVTWCRGKCYIIIALLAFYYLLINIITTLYLDNNCR